MPRKLIFLTLTLLLLSWSGLASARVRQGRVHIQAGKIDDECTVKYPTTIKAIRYSQKELLRGKRITVKLLPGVKIRHASTVIRTYRGKRSRIYMYRWTRGRKRVHFILKRKVRFRVRYDGKFRTLYLLPTSPRRRKGYPKHQISELKVVR